jgi:outer membrane murein-binding lipoprotein Lpp
MLLWVTAIVALLLAAAAWHRAGRLARKLEALNQSYWELRYDFTRLRSQVARLDPDTEQAEPAAAAAPRETVAFVSLNSMKKKG